MSRASQLTILQMNDTHAYLDLHPEMFLEGARQEHYRNAGGYARIATLFEQARSNNPDGVLALDNGDTMHGTYPAVQSQGQAIAPIVNSLALDGMTGHWDFAYGPARLQTVASMLDYPMLACNCYHEGTGQLVFPPYTVVERAGLKIGIIGIAEHIIDKTMPPHFSEGVYFTLGNEELPPLIDKLRGDERVDLVVVLAHVGFPQEVKIAREVDGIDVLLSGHTHNRLASPVLVNGTIIIQSGCHGSFVGRLDLEIEDGRIRSYGHDLIEVSESIRPDREVQAMVDVALEPHREMLQTIVGQTQTALNRYGSLEATMDNLLLQSLQEASGAQLAFSNGWRYGAPVPPGPLTMNDLWNIIPTNPPVSTVELTGEELLKMMEENLERSFSCDPYEQMGGYVKRCLGMRVFFKIENPAGLRVQQIFVGDEPVRPASTYSASFVTVQGVPKQYGANRANLDLKAIDALRQYVEHRGTVDAGLRGSVVAI